MGTPFTQPDFTAQLASAYKTNIDSAIAAMARVAAMFNPEAQDPADLTIHLDAGAVFNTETQALTEVAAQNSSSITAPSTDPRIDRVVINQTTGSLTIITGTEDPSPTPPAITAGNLPCAQIALVVSQSSIVNADITDERQLNFLGLATLAQKGIGDGLQDDGSGNLRVGLVGTSIARGVSGIQRDEEHDRRTGTYTAVAGDRGRIIEFDSASAITLNLTAAATLTEGWFVDVHNSGAGTLTIDPNGAELIDDAATITADQGVGFRIVCDGAAFWTIGKPAAAGGLTSISNVAITAVANIDITGFLPGTYDNYEVIISNMRPDTNLAIIELETSTDGGSIFDTGASDYTWAMTGVTETGTVVNQGDPDDSEIQLTENNGSGNEANENQSYTIRVYSPETAEFTAFTWDALNRNSVSATLRRWSGGGDRQSTADVDGLRLHPSAGSFTARGRVQFLGIAQ